jgi:pyruvate kinase
LIQHQYTKIVETLGPATGNPDVLRDCIGAGMSIARLDAANENSHEGDERAIQWSRLWQMALPFSNAGRN